MKTLADVLPLRIRKHLTVISDRGPFYSSEKDTDEYKIRKQLRNWNIVVAVVHSLSFVALLIINLINLPTARYVSSWIDTDRGLTLLSLGDYPVFATLLPFPFITAFFHILAVFDVDNYYQTVLQKGVNRLRWIEYAVTNGLMTVSLCFLVGAGNIMIVLLLVLANGLMQYFGYLHEMYNAHHIKQSLSFIWFGFVPWIQIWVVILTYYHLNFDTAPLYEGFAVYGSLLFSLLFVVPLLARHYNGGSYNAPIKRNYYTELMYLILSLTAKLYLDWTATIGNLSETS